MNPEKMTDEQILSHLNALVKEWSQQFENPPAELPINFSCNASRMLCVNGVALCFIQYAVPDKCSYDLETVYLSSFDGTVFEIDINWPASGAPYMQTVLRVATLFTAP